MEESLRKIQEEAAAKRAREEVSRAAALEREEKKAAEFKRKEELVAKIDQELGPIERINFDDLPPLVVEKADSKDPGLVVDKPGKS